MLKMRFVFFVVCCWVSQQAFCLDICCEKLRASSVRLAAQQFQAFTFHVTPSCTQKLWHGFRRSISQSPAMCSNLGTMPGEEIFAAFLREVRTELWIPRLPTYLMNLEGNLTQYHALRVRRSTLQWGVSSGAVYSFPKTYGTLLFLPVICCYNPVLHGLIVSFDRSNTDRLMNDVKTGDFLPIDDEMPLRLATSAEHCGQNVQSVAFSSGVGLYLPPNCAFVYEVRGTTEALDSYNLSALVQLVLRREYKKA